MPTLNSGPTVVNITGKSAMEVDAAMWAAWRAEARLTLARDTLVSLDLSADDRAGEAVAMVSEAIDAYTAAIARLDSALSR